MIKVPTTGILHNAAFEVVSGIMAYFSFFMIQGILPSSLIYMLR